MRKIEIIAAIIAIIISIISVSYYFFSIKNDINSIKEKQQIYKNDIRSIKEKQQEYILNSNILKVTFDTSEKNIEQIEEALSLINTTLLKSITETNAFLLKKSKRK